MRRWWLGRMAVAFLRRREPGRGLPTRAADRVEGAAALVALVLALVTVPLALWIGGLVHRYDLGVSAAEMATQRQVQAKLVADPVTQLAHDGASVSNPAPATWLGPDRVRHTESVAAPLDARSGSTVPIWIDQQGHRVDPPITPDQAFWRAVLAGLGVASGAGLLTWGGLWVVRSRCDRHREAAWERAWRATEPLWSQRR